MKLKKYSHFIRISNLFIGKKKIEFINGINSILNKSIRFKSDSICVFMALNLGSIFFPSSVLLILMRFGVWMIFVAYLSLGCRNNLNNSFTKTFNKMRENEAHWVLLFIDIGIQFLHLHALVPVCMSIWIIGWALEFLRGYFIT